MLAHALRPTVTHCAVVKPQWGRIQGRSQLNDLFCSKCQALRRQSTSVLSALRLSPSAPKGLSEKTGIRMGNARFGNTSGSTAWDNDVVCAQSGNGTSFMLPRQPAPMGPEAPSGLSRPAQLSVVQTVGLPAMPAYCAKQGGLVRALQCIAWSVHAFGCCIVGPGHDVDHTCS